MSERAPRSQVVSEEIRAMILGGRLKPGERLVEESLSAELGVSRVPVREALLALSAQGLVRIEPRRGATVAEITPRIVAELVEVRALLEGLNALGLTTATAAQVEQVTKELFPTGTKGFDRGAVLKAVFLHLRRRH